jgi:retinol dehydrogenase-12
LASDEGVGATSGGYFNKKKPVAVKSKFNTAANNKRLWQLSEQLTGTQFLD